MNMRNKVAALRNHFWLWAVMFYLKFLAKKLAFLPVFPKGKAKPYAFHSISFT
jgi:hypothetical protein